MKSVAMMLALIALIGTVAFGATLQEGTEDAVGPDLVVQRTNTCTFRHGPGLWFITGWLICIEVEVSNQGDAVSAPTNLKGVLTMRFRPSWVDPPIPEEDLQNINAPTFLRMPFIASVPAIAPGQSAIVPHVTMPIIGEPGAPPEDPWRYDEGEGKNKGSLPYPPSRLYITLDPYNRVKESNEGNNAASFRVSIFCGRCSQEEECRCKEYGPFF